MIEQSLIFTKNSLDNFLRNKFDLTDGVVQINHIVDTNGSVPQSNQNKVVVSLINVEQETNQPFYSKKQKLKNGKYADVLPFDRFNLDLLISAQFDDYKETLKFLNATILFFQVNQNIDVSTFSNLPEGIPRLEFVIRQLNYSEIHNLWNAIGAKYVPSVVYQMRLLEINAKQVAGFDSALQEPKMSIGKR